MVLYLSDNSVVDKNWKGPEEQDFSNYTGENYFDKIKDLDVEIKDVELPPEFIEKFKGISPVHESDIFRYYALYKYGGFYSDMDVLYFRPIDSLYDALTKRGADTLLYQCDEYVAIGMLGSSVDNPFFKGIYDSCLQVEQYNNYQSFGNNHIYTLYDASPTQPYILDKIQDRYPNLTIYNISKSLIYHFDWTKIAYNYKTPVGIGGFNGKSIGYHWYGGSPISQDFNNKMNENNYDRFRTTFSELTKKILTKNE